MGKFLDLIEIDAASNRGIEEIRDLKEKIGFLPVQGKYKVYIIDEVHMLTGEAFNALLKTLEEPPQNVIIILATTEAHKLPATILSRVQRFDFRLASEADLIKKLTQILKEEGFDSDDGALYLIAQGGMGSFRDSETLLDKVISGLQKGAKLLKDQVETTLGYTNSKTVSAFIDAMAENQPQIALDLFNKIFEGGTNLVQFVKQVLEIARERVVKAVEKGNTQEIREYMQIIKEFNQISLDIKFALLPRVLVEMAVLNLSTDGPVSLIERKHKLKEALDKNEVKTHQEEIASVNIDEIKSKWLSVINESRQNNHHLVAVLTVATLDKSDSGALIINVPFAFHKNRLSDSETKKILQKIFLKVYGHEIPYQCRVDRDLAEKAKEVKGKGNEKLVEDILK